MVHVCNVHAAGPCVLLFDLSEFSCTARGAAVAAVVAANRSIASVISRRPQQNGYGAQAVGGLLVRS